MNSNSSEKIFQSTKKRKERKKIEKPSIEAIKATIEKKKQCNRKALEIVIQFSEGNVSEECLVQNMPFLSQEHYQDIIEERAINKLCGYPLCTSNLKSIPTKQYHISTVHNKVFDITDRKNFCSNLCYKASKYLKEQIPLSPIWLRENDSTATYQLISLHSKGGIAGDEVDLGVASIKADWESFPNVEEIHSDKHNHIITPSVPKDMKENAISLTNSLNDVSKLRTSSVELHPAEDDYNKKPINTSANYIQVDSLSTVIPQSVNNILATVPKPTELTKSEQTSNDKSKYLTELFKHNKEEGDSTESSVKRTMPTLKDDLSTRSVNLKSRKIFSKNKLHKNQEQTYNSPLQNMIIKIEKIIKEWVSINTLYFMFGEEKIKEMLAEKKNIIKESYNTGNSVDSRVYEQYLAICKKLNLLELEDIKTDASYREEVKHPVPDYSALKEEAKKMDLKVKMFYKGDKIVEFEDLQGSSKDHESENSTLEPILPLVDLHAQKALRRRIVSDKLKRILQDLQKTLGLRGFNLTEDVRPLLSTFTLSAHNITLKPEEWNLVGLLVIKMLSLRDKALEQALNISSTKNHLTLLLLSYSLDEAYLDRLIVWLTDIEYLLHKNEE